MWPGPPDLRESLGARCYRLGLPRRPASGPGRTSSDEVRPVPTKDARHALEGIKGSCGSGPIRLRSSGVGPFRSAVRRRRLEGSVDETGVLVDSAKWRVELRKPVAVFTRVELAVVHIARLTRCSNKACRARCRVGVVVVVHAPRGRDAIRGGWREAVGDSGLPS